jgi:thiol-disulfide isomerase/thioredoxin
MNGLKRSDYLNIIQALILLSFSVPDPAIGGWLEAMKQDHPAPTLNLKDITGTQYDLNDLKGKTVLVNFWATWCPPCIEEMPSLIRLYEEVNQSGFIILAVNVEEDKLRVSKIAARLKLTFPVLLDSNRQAGDAWKVKVFPSSFLVDARGRLRYRAIGPVAWDSDEITSIIHHVLQE